MVQFSYKKWSQRAAANRIPPALPVRSFPGMRCLEMHSPVHLDAFPGTLSVWWLYKVSSKWEPFLKEQGVLIITARRQQSSARTAGGKPTYGHPTVLVSCQTDSEKVYTWGNIFWPCFTYILSTINLTWQSSRIKKKSFQRILFLTLLECSSWIRSHLSINSEELFKFDNWQTQIVLGN